MFVFNIEQGLSILPEWLSFNRVTVRLRQGNWSCSASSKVMWREKFSPHQAFAIGWTNSVRGYEEGAVASGHSYAVGSGEVSCCMFGPLEGVVFGDYGSDLGSGPKVPGDLAGARAKPEIGCGYGVGIGVDSHWDLCDSNTLSMINKQDDFTLGLATEINLCERLLYSSA